MGIVSKTEKIIFPSNLYRLTGIVTAGVEIDYSYDEKSCEIEVDDVRLIGITGLGVADWDIDDKIIDRFWIGCKEVVNGFKECIEVELKLTASYGLPFIDLSWETTVWKKTWYLCSECCERQEGVPDTSR